MGSSSKNQRITEFVGRLEKGTNFENFLIFLANLMANKARDEKAEGAHVVT